jgi:hypothetical protein
MYGMKWPKWFINEPEPYIMLALIVVIIGLFILRRRASWFARAEWFLWALVWTAWIEMLWRCGVIRF